MRYLSILIWLVASIFSWTASAGLCLGVLFLIGFVCPCTITTPFPLDSGVITLTQYGADPTCTTPSDAALAAANAAAPPSYPATGNPYETRIIYLNAGCYLFTGQVTKATRTVAAVTALTWTGGVATFTAPYSEGTNGDIFVTTISGATPSGLNGVVQATFVSQTGGTTTYTYATSVGGSGTATGSITYTYPTYNTNFALIGHDQSDTTIRLASGATPFQDASNPIGFVYTGSNPAFSYLIGSGNTGFGFYLENVTIDTNGNPGAIGVDWLSNNTGAIRNVTIECHNAAYGGITMTREYTGPVLLSGVTIPDCPRGITLAWPLAMVTMDTITIGSITGASQWCINLSSNIIAGNNITCTTSGNGKGFINDDSACLSCFSPYGTLTGLAVLQHSRLNGSGGSSAALSNLASWNFYDVVASGFGSGNCNPCDGSGHGATTGIPGPINWTLPATAAPTQDNTLPWVNANNYGANGYSVTNTWQLALNDSANAVVYFPTNDYTISSGVTVGDNIKRIEGMLSSVIFTDGPSNYCVFKTSPTRTNDLYVRRLNGVNNATNTSVCFIDWETPAPARLIVSDVNGPTGIISGQTCGCTPGNIFFENANVTHSTFNGGNVWLRQMDPEAASTKFIATGGAKIWALGFKSETVGTLWDISGASNVEVVGWWSFCGSTCTTGLGTLFNIDFGNGSGTSRLSASGAETQINAASGSTTWIFNNDFCWKLACAGNSAFPVRGPYNAAFAVNWSTDNTVPTVSTPTNTLAPTATGGTVCLVVPTEGTYCPTLTGLTGSWVSLPTPPAAANEGNIVSFTCQWYRTNHSTPIMGATNCNSYTVVTADVGHPVSLGVKGVNTSGTSSEVFTGNLNITSTTFDPTMISGIQVWYDAAAGSTVHLSGSNVTQWDDKSGNANNLTAASGHQPTLITADQNGLNTIQLASASPQTMTLMSNLNLNASGYTIVAVVKRAGPSGTNQIDLFGNSGTTAFGGEWASSSICYTGLSAGYVRAAGCTNDTNYHVIRWQVDSTVSAASKIFEDGVDQTTNLFTTGLPNALFDTLGKSESSFMNGRIAEVIVFSGINNTDGQNAEQYELAKWNIQ